MDQIITPLDTILAWNAEMLENIGESEMQKRYWSPNPGKYRAIRPKNPGKYNENPDVCPKALENTMRIHTCAKNLGKIYVLDFLFVLNLCLPLVCFLVLLRAPPHPKPPLLVFFLLTFFVFWVSFVRKRQKRPISCTFTGFGSFVLPTPLSSNASFCCLLLFFSC